MTENGNGSKSITQIIDEGTAIEEALDKAFYRAVLLHRQAGVPMTFCDEAGNVIEKDPQNIPIPEKYANLEPFRY